MVYDKKSLLRLYKNEYLNRLTPKPPLPEYEDIQILKEQLFEYRLKLSSMRKSNKWQVKDILNICRTLKNGKSRDECGLIYELFKPDLAGPDLLTSLTILYNKMKDTSIIPEFMQRASITSFQKSKGSRSDLGNQRGVFCMSKVRSILEKLLHSDYYDHIDERLSSSNVGGRKRSYICHQ